MDTTIEDDEAIIFLVIFFLLFRGRRKIEVIGVDLCMMVVYYQTGGNKEMPK